MGLSSYDENELRDSIKKLMLKSIQVDDFENYDDNRIMDLPNSYPEGDFILSQLLDHMLECLGYRLVGAVQMERIES